jgi:AraC family transcriptional activator of pobA
MTPRAEDETGRHGALVVRRFTDVRLDPHRRPVTHDYVALVFCTAGSLELELRLRLHLTAGDVLLLPAGEPHRMVQASGVVGWVLGFCGACLARTELGELLAPLERVRAGGSAVTRIAAERQEHLERLFGELAQENARGRDGAHALVERSLLALILAELARATVWTTEATTLPPLVSAALQFIERHCFESISLRDVAAALGRSPAHLTTALRQATGRTAQAWIIAGRMGETRRRLLTTDESIEEIAGRVGYADPTHFIRLFRRAHGLPPAAWRALHRR